MFQRASHYGVFAFTFALGLLPNALRSADKSELPRVTFTSNSPDSFEFTWELIDSLPPTYRDDCCTKR